ncbi:lysozyme C, milk isozyme-like [Amblyraja radiata]|uniref:lysozyme C, milk isozyme-like n=1 Tax=Amblyraja radiata TaxID=386614 RepID=UPI001403F363|nr:lysozyme C, milk isozyme-like [Amblyraja radiata]
MKTFILLSALLFVASPYIFEKCELAQLLLRHGLDGYRGYSLANWVCLVEHESGYNTRVVGRNRRGGKTVSSDYGIFQISSTRWCRDGQTTRRRNTDDSCGRSCQDFINENITDDIECAKKVVLPQGMNAWYSWKKKCKQSTLTKFLKECDV